MAILPPGSFVLFRSRDDGHWAECCALAQIDGPSYVFVNPFAAFFTETIAELCISTWTWEELATQPFIFGGPPFPNMIGQPAPQEPIFRFNVRPSGALLASWITMGQQMANEARAQRGFPPRENHPPRATATHIRRPAFAAIAAGRPSWNASDSIRFLAAARPAMARHAASIFPRVPLPPWMLPLPPAPPPL